MLPALSPTSKRAPAQAARSPSPEQSMKMSASDRLAAGLGLDHQRVDAALVMHHHAGAERMKQNIDLVARQQIVGRDLVGRGVIGLRQDLPENQMRRVEPAEAIDPRRADRRRCPAPPDASRHGHWHAARRNSSPPPPCPCRRETHSARSAACAAPRAPRPPPRRSRPVRRRARRLHIRRKAAPGARVLRWCERAR